MIARLIIHDKRYGRFVAAPSPGEITPEWLQREVYAQLPEVVGTAWDNRTSQAEVAATLARLVQEGKLASHVEQRKILVFTNNELHLELRVPRSDLVGHERSLVDALFKANDTTTSTAAVRERYKKSGFNPAGVIQSALRTRVDRLAPDATREQTQASRLPTMIMLVAAVLLLIAATILQPSDGIVAFFVLLASFPLYGIAQIGANDFRDRVLHLAGVGALVIGIPILMTFAFAWYALGDHTYRFSALGLAGLTLLILGLINSIMNRARLVLSPERVALRRRLAAARAYFARELAKETPNLTDATYPYLLAFGLGSHVDRWFKAFGGEAVNRNSYASSSIASAGVSRSSGGHGAAPFSGFGGGGGFSGGGGGASFGAAIGGMASSVPSPSTSSSGSSSSSSSSSGSSGGGGGGGW